MMHPVYTTEYAESVKPQHKVPEKVRIVPCLSFVSPESTQAFAALHKPGRSGYHPGASCLRRMNSQGECGMPACCLGGGSLTC